MADEHRNDEVTNETRDFERALAALRPHPSRIDRDRLMYLAGRASEQAAHDRSTFSRWAWPMSTCASIAAALVMAAMLVARPAADTNDAADGAKHAAQRELRSPATNDASADSLASASHETDGAGRMESREQGTDSRDAFGWQRSRLPATLAVRDFEDNPNYLQLRSLVLAHGFGALPKRDTGVVANAGPPREDLPRTQRELLKEFLNSDPTGQDKRL